MTLTVERQDDLVWWCAACRAAGHVHCAYVEECLGHGMKRIPRAQAEAEQAVLARQQEAR